METEVERLVREEERGKKGASERRKWMIEINVSIIAFDENYRRWVVFRRCVGAKYINALSALRREIWFGRSFWRQRARTPPTIKIKSDEISTFHWSECTGVCALSRQAAWVNWTSICDVIHANRLMACVRGGVNMSMSLYPSSKRKCQAKWYTQLCYSERAIWLSFICVREMSNKKCATQTDHMRTNDAKQEKYHVRYDAPIERHPQFSRAFIHSFRIACSCAWRTVNSKRPQKCQRFIPPTTLKAKS